MPKETKNLTINDLNIGDTFRYSGQKGYWTLIDFADFINEETGDVETMAHCVDSKNYNVYLEFSQPIISKINKK